MMRRFGRFHLDADLVENDQETARRVMGCCVILQAEPLWDRHCIQYVAISPMFAEADEDSALIDYEWIVTPEKVEVFVVGEKAA